MTKPKVDIPDGPSLEAFIGRPIILLCQNYFYSGTLLGVFDHEVLLSDASIVYETGEWSDRKWKDAQALPSGYWRVMRSSIESYGMGK